MPNDEPAVIRRLRRCLARMVAHVSAPAFSRYWTPRSLDPRGSFPLFEMRGEDAPEEGHDDRLSLHSPLLSEDFQDGMDFAGVNVVDPFS